MPANGAWGAGENGDDAHEDPVDPDPMEETGPDNEADFVNGEEEEEDNDDDGFIDGEVRSALLGGGGVKSRRPCRTCFLNT